MFSYRSDKNIKKIILIVFGGTETDYPTKGAFKIAARLSVANPYQYVLGWFDK